MRVTLVALALLGASDALAQSGLGRLSGVVLPKRASNIGGFGDWGRAADTARVATVTLHPVRTLACRARPATDCAPTVVAARGLYGRYGPVRLSMGEYRMTVAAPGCTAQSQTVVILSDSESVIHAALTCAPERP